MPAVTVIIIFLNEQRFLEEAIGSVLAQSYSHWQLLLVDDGSTDGSTEIAQRHAALDPARVRYLEHAGHANLGMSASRNLGVAHAQCEFICFLDADDVWLPDKLAEQVSILAAHPDVSMVYGRTLIWHSWNIGVPAASQDHYCELGVQPDTVIEPPRLLQNLIENRTQTPTTCNAMLRRRVLVAVGGFESEFRGMFEDQVFFMKVCLRERVFVSSRTWARYRQRDDSCSAIAEVSGRVLTDRLRLLEWLASYLRRQSPVATEIWRTLQREHRALRHPHWHRMMAAFRGIRGVLGRQGT